MTVEFEECIKDSPRFRATIDEVETDVVEIEAKLDKLVKLCSGMIEAGKVYITTNKHFVSGVRDLSQQCRNDEVVSECLQKFGDSLQEMINYHMILFDQAQRSVRQQLHNFVKDDVRKFKETKKQFDKVREDMEMSLVKNAQAPRHRPHEVEEATGALTLTRKCFRHLALDYVLQINVLQAKKKFEILDAMLSFMHAQYAFFQQGYSLLHQLDPYMKKLAAELDQLVIDSAVEKREMERKHALIQQRTLLQDFSYDESKVEFDVDAPNGVVMEGYLFKRASNAFKTWNRRWFSIQNSQLVYQKKLKDGLTVVVDDLRLCTVKPCEDIERRFCFEVVSPTKSCMLQADSEKLRQAWVQAVQASIASAYRESPDSYYIERLDRTASPSTSSIDSAPDTRDRSSKGESILQRVQSVAGNGQCCDCGQPDPRWASINLGILLCIECSGIHRSLGVHCSKVRSLTLDSWEPELLKLMCELGNSTVNQIYEAQCEELGLQKPTASSPRQDKEAWIKVKYVERKFLKKLPGAGAEASETAGGGEAKPRRWSMKKCRRHQSSPRVPRMRRQLRQEPTAISPAALSSASTLERKFRRDSLFCPDELDSLFSYFDTGAAGAGPRSAGHMSAQAPPAAGQWDSGLGPGGTEACLPAGGLSSDSGLGGSTDGSSDILVFGSVVDSVMEEEGEVSEDSSAEGDRETWDLEDSRELHPGLLAYRAARARNLPVLAEALAHGAEVNWVNEEDESKTPLIQAVMGGSLIICEFLLQNGADVNQRDSRGRAPLHHATYLGHTGQVCLFLKRGADQHALDEDQQDPLAIAVQAANADIVTLLRLARMNEEMREAEGPLGQPGDTTYLDIFREFSHMASHHPEKLNRQSLHVSPSAP
ncbi:arf-GAP with coiled-coil, ANK repeat and PH domain-containing protein 3 isoform X1 [Trichosurus vulpecula]|uniref:arf-GAP with coiled-coil, ANK repeat and PH domain-containing protein 3 isoform X1 n=1 Tax=Trichosurus vulpecula TaxID=9337 RepID=UPI00186AF8FB|nr:arf-GAP with coiled-coil, ANK repeat and PH domain-containing protein 3 isoform X1 [Trichosurus vulpecula]